MFNIIRTTLFFTLAMPASLSISAPTPPQAPQHPHPISQQGQTRVDPFFWLRDKKNPETIKYLEGENRYTDLMLKPVQGLREKLYREMRGRIQETDLSVPYRIDDYYYYARSEAGKQYEIFCRKKGDLNAPEEVLLDENVLAQGLKYCSVGVLSVSPNHRLLAYSVDTDGGEVFTLRVKNLETGEMLPDTITGTSYSFAWAADSRSFFYDVLDSAKRPYKAMRHVLGSNVPSDSIVLQEPDERFELSIEKSRSRQFIFFEVESKLATEIRFIHADRPEETPVLIQPREKELIYHVEHHGDRFFLVTNRNAKNFKIVSTPVDQPSKEHWSDLAPYDPNIAISGIEAFKDHLVALERRRGLPVVRIYNLKTGESHAIDFAEPAYNVELAENPDFASSVVRLEFSSLITPKSVIDYDMVAQTKTIRKQTPVLGGFNRDNYAEEQIYAKADDGVEIPISLFYRKGFRRNGSAPIILHGYGAYGLSEEAEFSSARLSLVDRGIVFAIAHIRGGGELGRTWYEDGKLLKKKNTFTDFIRCAEYLLEQKYGSPHALAIDGGSAGGLLMGSVMNMRRDLFTTVIAAVPFVDILNTMSDPSLPLTVTEYEEWGNPAERPYYDYIRSYSPYDNVEDRPYPNLLVTAGLNDPRVSYWEPAKWVAKQRTLKNQNHLLLLHTNMGAGHMGESGRFDRL
ncbi:MAG TPA: S9 family peptidase, partial [Chthoniobacterales bacterium]|nr:S9 family peptidase [Chthoniobacterales bacterium]